VEDPEVLVAMEMRLLSILVNILIGLLAVVVVVEFFPAQEAQGEALAQIALAKAGVLVVALEEVSTVRALSEMVVLLMLRAVVGVVVLALPVAVDGVRRAALGLMVPAVFLLGLTTEAPAVKLLH
jgi:hypothetical protein